MKLYMIKIGNYIYPDNHYFYEVANSREEALNKASKNLKEYSILAGYYPLVFEMTGQDILHQFIDNESKNYDVCFVIEEKKL